MIYTMTIKIPHVANCCPPAGACELRNATDYRAQACTGAKRADLLSVKGIINNRLQIIT